MGICLGTAVPIASLTLVAAPKKQSTGLFFYGLFESLQTEEQSSNQKVETLFFGPLEGIRTPVLQNRNLLRYPAAPQAEI